MNPNPWMQEQLHNEHRRDLERTAEQERAARSDEKQTAWQWLQDRMR
jgi:hypothetical protein